VKEPSRQEMATSPAVSVASEQAERQSLLHTVTVDKLCLFFENAGVHFFVSEREINYAFLIQFPLLGKLQRIVYVIQVENKTIKAQIRDTAGQGRYRAITSA
jgi:GTPase SAR1 family protein